MPKRFTVQLSEYEVARCRAYAVQVVAHYTRGDNWRANLPWTRDRLSPDGLRRWLASRKEAGRKIAIETCELGRWAVNVCDPYGIDEILGKLSKEEFQIGNDHFVRSPESDGWIWDGDLPADKARAMYDRIKREWEIRKTATKGG